jgi:hypothetical protein
MKTLLELCLIMGIASGLAGEGAEQQYRMLKALHPSAASFGEAPGQVLFLPSGKLYVAYRLLGESATSSTLRVVFFDPVTGQQGNVRDYPVPSAPVPRVATAFIMSQDGSTLAYAELHPPQVLVTIEVATLNPLSTSEASLFGEQDFAPHVSTLSSESLVLSAGKLTHDGKVTAVHEVRKISLSTRNLKRVVSEEAVPVGEDVSELIYWRKRIHAQHEVGQVLLLNDGVLGLTNLMSEGWIQLFDQAGKELTRLHNPNCGFVRASLSPDRQVGAAVCEETGLDEPHFGQTIRRDAVVFEVKTLKVIATIPMSRKSVKEHGSRRGDLWVAAPSPAIWHGKDRVLVAVPNFTDSIDLYSISADPLPHPGALPQGIRLPFQGRKSCITFSDAHCFLKSPSSLPVQSYLRPHLSFHESRLLTNRDVNVIIWD